MLWVSLFDTFMGTVLAGQRVQTDSHFAVVWPLSSWSVRTGKYSNASFPEKILTE